MDTTRDIRHCRAHKVRIAAGGRVVIPAEVRQDLGLAEGDEVFISRDENGIRISTLEQTVREVQVYFSGLKAQGESLVDDMIRDRRKDALKERRDVE